MRTYFEPSQDEEYQAAKSLLIRRCQGWAKEQGLMADPGLLAAAIDFRHLSADGRLAFWEPVHVRRLLLEWIPRHVAAEPHDLADAPASLVTLLRFLGESGLWDPRAGTVAQAVAAAHEAQADYLTAIADPRRQGIGKFWALAARDNGVDLGDSRAAADFAADIEAGRVRYDGDLLNDLIDAQMFGDGPEPRAIPQLPVSLPPPGELAAAAAASPLARQLRSLVAWLGPAGRPLTSAGHLRLADARELAIALGTGEERLRERSSAQWPQLSLILAWAKKARLVRVNRGRLVPVAKATALLADPEALWQRAFGAFFELADVICRPIWAGGGTSMLHDLYPMTVPDVMNTVYSMPHPVPVARLEESVWVACRQTYQVDGGSPWQQEMWRSHVCRDLAAMFEALAALGAVELTEGLADPVFLSDLEGGQWRPERNGARGEVDADGPPFSPDAVARLLARLAEPGRLVALTPLGTWAMRARLLAEGREAALVGELAQAEPAELLGVVIDHYTDESAAAEITGWLAAHGGDVEPLLQAVRACPFRSRALAMLETLRNSVPGGALLLRRLRGDRELAPAVLSILVQDHVLGPEDLTEREQMLMLTESLLSLLEVGGPAAVREELAKMPAAQARAVLGVAQASGHPATIAMGELRELVIEPFAAVDRIPRPARPLGTSPRGRHGHGRKRKR
jgi:hypothetical protein